MKYLTQIFYSIVLCSCSYLLAATALKDYEKLEILDQADDNTGHSFSCGVDVMSYKWLYSDSQKQVKVHTKEIRSNTRFGYEFINLNHFYFGFDLFSTTFNFDYDGFEDMQKINYKVTEQINGNVELRLGYTFNDKIQPITFFVEYGSNILSIFGFPSSQGVIQNFGYGSLGLKTTYTISSNLQLGLNAKATKFIFSSRTENGKTTRSNPKHFYWFGDLGLFCKAFFGASKTLSAQFEPLYSKPLYPDSDAGLGIKVLLGGRF